MTYDVFLSYSTKDSELALELRDAFLERGIKCFTSKKDIEAAADWEDSIRNAMIESHTVIVLLTPNSINSDWVLMEIGAAWALEKRRVAAMMHIDAKQITVPLSRKQGRNIETTSGREHFINEVATFERPATTPSIDFDLDWVGPAKFQIVVSAKNEVPFEYMTVIKQADGISLTKNFQVQHKRVFPPKKDDPITFEIEPIHIRGKERFVIVATVTFRELNGPFEDSMTKKFPTTVTRP